MFITRQTFYAGLVGAGAALMAAAPAQAVFFHIGSGSIDGSLCVGNDCVSSESFGFDTIRMKENNLRLHYDDTSTTASFPQNDWRIYANDSANGGSSYYGIEDATAGRFVFRVFAGARSNAMVIDSQGDLGLGTTTPATDIDINIGDSPTVRLQQDGTSGFTPQTWDMAGNETNFFIRDATHGSTLPFRIRPGAPSDAIVIAGDVGTGDPGDVGIGTSAPRAPLHILTAGTAAAANAGDDLIIQDNGPARFALVNTAATDTTWTFNSNNTLRISGGTDASEFELQHNGNAEFGGTCLEFDSNNGTRFACTFTAGGGVACAAAGTSCP